MATVTTSDIITEDRVRRIVEQEQDYALVWEDMFEEIPVEGNGPTFHIPEDEGLMSEPTRVNEGSEFPRTEEDYDTLEVSVEKHGFEVTITRESSAYSIFDIVAQQMEKAARRFNEYLNRLAYEEIDANLHPNSPVTASNFDFGLVTDGKKEIQDSLYNPQMIVVNSAAENELLNSEAFRQASDLGDEVTLDGAIGRVAGLDVMLDRSDLLPTDDPVGYMVDPDEYGYEVIQNDVEINEYDDQSRQATIMQWYTERTWKAIDEEACIKLETV